MITVKTCASCGSDKIRRMHRDWADEYEGIAYVVPDLEYYECPDCEERVYDRDGMRKSKTTPLRSDALSPRREDSLNVSGTNRTG